MKIVNGKQMLPRTAFSLQGAEAWIEHAESESGADRVSICVKCPECGQVYTKPLGPKELEDVELLYGNGGRHPGGFVQDMFPSWTPAERETFLMSNICDGCWNRVMGGEP